MGVSRQTIRQIGIYLYETPNEQALPTKNEMIYSRKLRYSDFSEKSH